MVGLLIICFLALAVRFAGFFVLVIVLFITLLYHLCLELVHTSIAICHLFDRFQEVKAFLITMCPRDVTVALVDNHK